MKLLICSDSHGARRSLLRIAEKETPDVMLFLGDGLRDADYVAGRCPALQVLSVRGNCDYSLDGAPEDWLTEFEGVRIYLCHGHRYGVKTDLRRLRKRGLSMGARLVLFGHTHRPLLREEPEVTLLNPGSVGEGMTASYAVVRLSGGGRMECQLRSL